jgi:hypothetical protein
MLLTQLNVDAMHDTVHGTPLAPTSLPSPSTTRHSTTPHSNQPGAAESISHIRRHRACHRLAQGF